MLSVSEVLSVKLFVPHPWMIPTLVIQEFS